MSKESKPIIEFRNYYLPSSFPILLLTGNIWKISDIKSEHLHFHNCLEVGICHSQSGILEFYNTSSIPFSEGDVTCIPRNIPHTTYSNPHMKSQWSYLFFDPLRLFRDILPPDFRYTMIYDDIHKYIIPAGSSPRILLLAKAALEELSAVEPDCMLVKSYMYALYMEIIRFQNSEIKRAHDRCFSLSQEVSVSACSSSLSITPALDYIEDNYMNKFTIEWLAQLCHMSPTHFRRCFRSVMNTQPLNYLNSIRIMNACNLLRNTNHTILSISVMSGFSSLSNFNRHFNQMMKISPTEYRLQTLQCGVSGKIPSIVEYKGWMEPDKIPLP